MVDGTRVKKSDKRVGLYGQVDELNSSIGLLVSHLRSNQLFTEDNKFLESVQRNLFVIGSTLACPLEKRKNLKIISVEGKEIQLVEQEIDKLDEKLPSLKSFVLPGGDLGASYAHLSRAICRRVERELVEILNEFIDHVPSEIIIYLNRLADYFFVLARSINFRMNQSEILWSGAR